MNKLWIIAPCRKRMYNAPSSSCLQGNRCFNAPVQFNLTKGNSCVNLKTTFSLFSGKWINVWCYFKNGASPNKTYQITCGGDCLKTNGVLIGFPLLPVISIIFLEALEQQVLLSSQLQRKVWFRYVDETFDMVIILYTLF